MFGSSPFACTPFGAAPSGGSTVVTVGLTGIASGEAWGLASLTPAGAGTSAVGLAGIASGEAWGALSLVATVALAAGSIPTGERWGNLVAVASATNTTPDVRAAVVAILKNSPAVAALVGDKIRAGRRPQTFGKATSIVVGLVSNPRGHNLDGADGTAKARLALGFYSTDGATGLAAKIAAEKALDGFRGYSLGLEVFCKQLDERDDYLDNGSGDDAGTYSVTVDYLIKHRVSIPAF